MELPDMPGTDENTTHLVSNRTDFAFVYMSSFASMVLLITGSWVVTTRGMPFSELWFLILVAAVVALVPPVVARFIKTYRRVIQLMFGAMLAPFIAAVIINGITVFKAVSW